MKKFCNIKQCFREINNFTFKLMFFIKNTHQNTDLSNVFPFES